MTQPHPDDESLSAALDGEDTPTAAHVAGCAECLARTDALDGVRLAVAGGPTAAPPALADRAVAAALAAFAEERAGPTAAPPAATDGDGVVVPFRPAPGAPGGLGDSFSSHPASTSGGRGRRVPGWAMGAAAALAALLVAVPVLNRDSGTGPDQVATAARDDARKATTEAAAPVVDGGDLGDQADQLLLGEVLAGAVTGTPAASPSPLSADQPAVAAAESAAPTRAADAGPAGGAEAPAAAAPAPAPAQSSVTPSTPSNAASADPAAVAACEQAVATEYGRGLGPLLYRATLRWQGTPAVVFAYRLADTSANGPDHRAFVMALDGCRLLVVQGF